MERKKGSVSVKGKKREVRIIGLTGRNASGKGEVAAYLRKKGFQYLSLSDLIRDELEKEGTEINRDNLIKKGNELRERFGPDTLARRIMERVRKKSVIDSIRNPKEVEYLKMQKGFILLAVDAPVELRFARAQMRGRKESASTLEEFIAKETEELAGSEKGQQLLNCLKMADITILNSGSLEELHQKLEELL